MKFVNRRLPDDVNVFFAGDMHIGSALHCGRALDKFVTMIQSGWNGLGSEYNYAVLMGDYIEAIDFTDKRFDFPTVDVAKIRPQVQIEHLIDKLRPIADRILVMLYGNHEHKLMRYCDYVEVACRELGCPYGTYTSVIDIGHNKIFATHGAGSISSTADSAERRAANMLISLKRKLKNKSADCSIMAMGHTHKLQVAPPVSSLYLTSDGSGMRNHYTGAANGNYIPPDARWYLNTGSMLKLYGDGVSGYAERAGYDPVEIGWLAAAIRGGSVVDIKKIVQSSAGAENATP